MLVMIETISTFRHRYLVELDDTKVYNLDDLIQTDLKEMSQLHLGEVISSAHHVNEVGADLYLKEYSQHLAVEDVLNRV